MMRAFRYAFDEALASLWRGRSSGLLSTITIALALFVLGAFLLVASNLQRLGSVWSSTAEMSVYLTDEVTAVERDALETILRPGDTIAAREYVSKDEAAVRFKQTFGDLAASLEGVGDNPLPASYEVRLQTGAGAREALEGLAGRLKLMAGVSDVRYDRQWLDRLAGAVRIIRGVGLMLGLVLTIAAALTVANVVRLALHERRDEIDIMELVGAPQAYVRGPFLMEGVLHGGIGALLGLGALVAGYVILRARYVAPLASTVDVSAVRFLPVELCIVFVAGGMLVGCIGGLVAAGSRSAMFIKP
jgi:cell division transport system permease protein